LPALHEETSMTTTGDDRQSPHCRDAEPRILVDVTGARLSELMESQDPRLAASIRELNGLIDQSSKVRLGWQSAIPEG
jgi:hypothetical protein